jgi:hypothetical protein
MTLAHRPDFLDYRRDGDLGVDVLGAAFSGPPSTGTRMPPSPSA